MLSKMNRNAALSRSPLYHAFALAGALLGLGLLGAGCAAETQPGDEDVIVASTDEGDVPKEAESIKQCYSGVRCGPLQFDPDLGYYAVCCASGHCALDPDTGDGYCF